MASLPPEQGQALLAHVKQDKNWAERTPKHPVGTNEWFRSVINRVL